MPAKKRVLFVCIENSCRSQMAEAFARLAAGERIEPYSAGSHPSGRINPKAVAAMAEIGCDLGGQRSKSLDELPKVKFDAVVTMGCGDECPFIPAERHEDWSIPDPKDLPLEEFRRVRDLIGQRVRELAERLSV